jgi:hypothetical protein
VSVCGTVTSVTHFKTFLGSVVEPLRPPCGKLVAPNSFGANLHIR